KGIKSGVETMKMGVYGCFTVEKLKIKSSPVTGGLDPDPIYITVADSYTGNTDPAETADIYPRMIVSIPVLAESRT
ncbi:MAG TPA: hypothetical protein VKO43_08305, partial [Candidatus Krumholzibacteriaceae bacterium]|nr:hypothetical protein [Candidatus Krumholzibacteriaceae bacterium]